jgi:uncharacterized protein (TIRG00374 family)
MLFAFRGQDIGEMWEAIKKANFLWIALALIISLISHWARGIRWVLLIKPLGYSPSNANAVAAVFIGYLANLAFPRMGEVTRCASLRKADKIPVESLLGTVVAERALDVFCLGIVLLLTILFQAELIFDFLKLYLFNPITQKVEGNSGILLFVLIMAVSLLFTLYYIFKKYKEMILANKIAGKITNLFNGIKNGVLTIFKLEKPALFLFHTFLIWGGYFLSTWLFFYSIEATSHLGPSIALFALVLSSLGMAAPVQGGIGAVHYMVSQGLLLFGISLNEGLIYATILHSSQTLLVLIMGAISLLYLLKVTSNTASIEDVFTPDNIIASDEKS